MLQSNQINSVNNQLVRWYIELELLWAIAWDVWDRNKFRMYMLGMHEIRRQIIKLSIH